ncbi:hypothetical protein BDP27DRAFT_986386 [Rhodocollybia butyracea]|uniref:Uncharacterized protein n=1 Tax=Rhodocollybia butyracea TaxID=206335 RepID=A0A9P5PNV0_9AGAR|nr:hypothetical protein BDP27DRAFT_986386 [Rhodocollybia butyracea]
MRDEVGQGSKTSPIFISDDEGEMADVSEQLLYDTPSSSSLTGSAFSQFSAPKRAKPGPLAVEKRSLAGKIQPEGSKKRKRKHEQSVASHNAAGPSRLPHPAAHRKRARQQERASRWQRDAAAHRQVFDDAAFESEPYASGSFSSSYPMDTFPHLAPMAGSSQSSPLNSSSDWVNSMVKAADPPVLQSLLPIPWEFFLSPPTPWVPQPLLQDPNQPSSWPAQPISIPSNTIPDKPPSLPASASTYIELPKKPSSTGVIGMPPARDPQGRRGGFKTSATTVFESKPHITYPHTPDPSRSLIMDQLPKLCRTPLWLQSWGERACGSQPVFLAIDSSSAKAILEFASADLAEKAWSSPKLGKGISSLSVSQLKGKQREDLIRVWWYRASSPELVFTRKELEEGEIEDDEPMVDGRRESKKEKRARLAKLAKDDRDRHKRESGDSSAKSQSDLTNNPISSVPLLPSYPASVTHELSSSDTPPSYDAFNTTTLPPPSFHATLPPPPPSPIITHPVPQPSLSTWSSPAHSYPPPTYALPLPSSTHAPQASSTASLTNGWSVNAFTGPLPFHALSNPFGPAEDRVEEADMDMELSSPTAPHSLISEAMDAEPVKIRASLLPADNADSARLSSPRRLPTPIPMPSPIASPPTASPGRDASPSYNSPKTVPREPSFVKRTLLARQKELEERIARSKLELEQNKAAGEQSDAITQGPSIQNPIPRGPRSLYSSSPSPRPVSEPPLDKQAMETHLRHLVMASQKKKQYVNASAIARPEPLGDEDAGTDFTLTVVSDPAPSDVSSGARTPSTATAVESMLDDLAVSFIQESIQTVNPAPPLPVPAAQIPVPPVKPLSSHSSTGLAARREQLEFQIAETKRLMELLTRATTKQAKDSIMTQIREISRCVNVTFSLSFYPL